MSGDVALKIAGKLDGAMIATVRIRQSESVRGPKVVTGQYCAQQFNYSLVGNPYCILCGMGRENLLPVGHAKTQARPLPFQLSSPTTNSLRACLPLRSAMSYKLRRRYSTIYQLAVELARASCALQPNNTNSYGSK